MKRSGNALPLPSSNLPDGCVTSFGAGPWPEQRFAGGKPHDFSP